ncbi:MAG: shikimate kinase [Lachnospiraceae bacterium]|nr:shikimate kinase [Lachnospiraceae bacterium]
MNKLTEHIFLIGFMGVGKTSVSRALSRKLGVREIDTDALIVEQEGMSIARIFEERGEEAFRQTETELLDQVSELSPCIVSCGGGMALRSENVEKMKRQGKIILLSAVPETIYEHVKDSTHRPLLNGNMNVEYIAQLLAARMPGYRAAADIEVRTDELSPRQVAEKITELI